MRARRSRGKFYARCSGDFVSLNKDWGLQWTKVHRNKSIVWNLTLRYYGWYSFLWRDLQLCSRFGRRNLVWVHRAFQLEATPSGKRWRPDASGDDRFVSRAKESRIYGENFRLSAFRWESLILSTHLLSALRMKSWTFPSSTSSSGWACSSIDFDSFFHTNFIFMVPLNNESSTLGFKLSS